MPILPNVDRWEPAGRASAVDDLLHYRRLAGGVVAPAACLVRGHPLDFEVTRLVLPMCAQPVADDPLFAVGLQWQSPAG